MHDTAASGRRHPASLDMTDGSPAVANLKLIRAVHQQRIDVTAAISGDRRGPAARRARSEVAA